jgi:peroxiredoxin
MLHRRIITPAACFGVAIGLVAAGWLLSRYISARPDTEADDKRGLPQAVISNANQMLPPYRLADLNGQEIPTDKLRHGRVLLIYLTTGCAPCTKEAELISRLQQGISLDIHIYGVYIERPAQVATFIKEFDLKFPMLIDVDAQLAKSLDVHYFPSKYFIEDGIIKEIWHGMTEDEAKLRQRLNIE